MDNFKNRQSGVEYIFVSSFNIERCLDRNVLIKSTISEDEFCQIVFDALIYKACFKDSVENYLYHWIYNSNPTICGWRRTIEPYLMNEIATMVNRIIELFKIDNPVVVDYLSGNNKDCTVTCYNNFVRLSF